MDDPNSPRPLIESPRFTKERERFAPDARRFDDAMRAIDLRLSRDPENGIRISRGGLYATCITFSDGRTFAIYYTFDDEKVVLESLRPDRILSDL
ncbi:MAG TPA: hypothetical protein VGX68_25330 [Thermoanaerobaculia bacterium]|nr:hypothetical protein [Thermoanaerobaculia bacterium]